MLSFTVLRVPKEFEPCDWAPSRTGLTSAESWPSRTYWERIASSRKRETSSSEYQLAAGFPTSDGAL